jgi:hypothetical protein
VTEPQYSCGVNEDWKAELAVIGKSEDDVHQSDRRSGSNREPISVIASSPVVPPKTVEKTSEFIPDLLNLV